MGKRPRTPVKEEVRDMDLRKHSPAVGTEPKAKDSDSSGHDKAKPPWQEGTPGLASAGLESPLGPCLPLPVKARNPSHLFQATTGPWD